MSLAMQKFYFTPSIIASDDIEEAQYTKPMLTTVGLPKEEMGRFALYLLPDRMNGRTAVVPEDGNCQENFL